MKVDTGASVSIMPGTLYHKLWPRRGLKETTIRLQTHSKEPIPAVVGATQVHVAYQGQSTTSCSQRKGAHPSGQKLVAIEQYKIRLEPNSFHYMSWFA